MRARVVVAAGVLGLAGVTAAHLSGGGPALYDGICQPISYRHLGGSPAPSSASQAINVGQTFPTSEVATDESTPQAQIILAESSFAVPPGSTVTVTIKPVMPPAVLPADGPIDGNVYDFAATGPGGEQLRLDPTHPGTVVLSATVAGGPTRAVEHFANGRWDALKTFVSGCGDTDEAGVQSLGLFALVAQGTTNRGGANGGGGGVPAAGGSALGLVVGLVAGVMVLVTALVAVARRSSRNRR